MKTLLITGATGFLGGATVSNILKEDESYKILLLVRGVDASQALERVRQNLRKFHISEILLSVLTEENIVLGDLAYPDLFLSDVRLNNVTHVINCAAVASFGNNPLIWRVNVEGTLKFVSRMNKVPCLERFIHVGTAMSCAPEEGSIVEEEFITSQRKDHIVEYTWSKATIERLIKQYHPAFPLIIARPSIVVGHSQLGCQPSSSIYWVFTMALTLGKFICSLEDKIDIVPVDYCAKALTLLLSHPIVEDEVYHISAGSEKSTSFAEIDKAIAEAQNTSPLGESYRQVSYQDLVQMRKRFPAIFGPCNERIMLRALYLYGQFSRLNVTFDNHNLLRLGLSSPPRFTDYVHNCVKTTQGKSVPELMKVDFK
ncbi:SDR family oxidoreductase [Atlantibacter hermannii]|uniref:SDR family oxidoreductase n=1 Tax=Atlantibacter hermannii TaxID=565 RepID=UPI0028B0999C|nr:SDR family oxidoreductase [Atlantibacter hermannii]